MTCDDGTSLPALLSCGRGEHAQERSIVSQGCTSALLRRRRARTGGEETFEGGAGEERAGGWPRPNDSCLLAPLFPACFPHTRCRQRLALEDSCVRSLFYVPASAQAERLSKEGRTEEKKRVAGRPPRGPLFPPVPSAVSVCSRSVAATVLRLLSPSVLACAPLRQQ